MTAVRKIVKKVLKTRKCIIGAYIPERDLVVVRRIVSADAGKRINFADNEQPDGVIPLAICTVFFTVLP